MGKIAAAVDVPSFGGALRIATTATIRVDSAISEDTTSRFATMGDTGNTAVPAGNYCYCSCSFLRQMETVRGLYEIWAVNGTLLHVRCRPSGFFSRATVHTTADYLILNILVTTREEVASFTIIETSVPPFIKVDFEM